jgi:josephin
VTTLLPENIFGYLVNIPSRLSLVSMSLPFPGKHWLAVRRIGDVYYDLDSKLAKPKIIGKDVLEYLNEFLKRDDSTQLLLVVTDDVADSRSWQNEIVGENMQPDTLS